MRTLLIACTLLAALAIGLGLACFAIQQPAEASPAPAARASGHRVPSHARFRDDVAQLRSTLATCDATPSCRLAVVASAEARRRHER